MSSPVYRLTAIILKRKNSGETDRVVTVFSREKGKLRLLAKGVRSIRSRRASFLEPLHVSQLMVRSYSGIDMLSEASAFTNTSTTEDTIGVVAAKYYIAELLDTLMPENEAHPLIFTESVAMLSLITRPDDEERVFRLISYTKYLLCELGFIPATVEFTSLAQAAGMVERIIEKRLKTRKFLAILR